MQLPNAMDPRWYLKIHHMPLHKEPLPDVSLVNEKYQTAHAAAMMNWQHPIMKALTQRPPKRWYKKMYLVYGVQATVVTNESGSGLG